MVGVVAPRTHRVVCDNADHDEAVVALLFRESLVISGSQDGLVVIWESTTGEALHSLSFGEAGVAGLSLALDAEVLVVEHDSGMVTTWTLPQA